ncbi:MAG: hypothetical protein ACKVPX_10985 [Myxococcaceae bacterium]
MTRKGVWIHGVLAAIALVAAYATWQRPDIGESGDVIALDVPRRQLEKVRYEDGPRWVELLPGDGRTLLRQSGREALTPQAPDQSKVEATPAVPERTLFAVERAADTLDRMAPLRAVRSLGRLNETKLKELGFLETKKRITLHARGAAHGFQVVSNPSANAGYARRESDGEVFIVSSSLLSDLDNQAMRLIDRRLHTFGKWEVGDKIILTSAKQNAQWEVTAKAAEGGGQLFEAAAVGSTQLVRAGGKEADGFGRNWNEKVFRIGIAEPLGQGEVPVGGAPQVELRVEYRRRTGVVGFIELGRAGGITYVRSENTPGWAKPSGTTADEVLMEVARVMKGS